MRRLALLGCLLGASLSCVIGCSKSTDAPVRATRAPRKLPQPPPPGESSREQPRGEKRQTTAFPSLRPGSGHQDFFPG
jgi:hypothetical protein